MIALTSSLRLRAVARDSQPVSMQSLLAGLKFVLATKLILATITLDLLAVFLGGAVALLPIYARDILDIGPTGLGWLRAAPSIGSFLMAVLLAHRPPMRRAGKSLLWAVAGFGAATIVFGLSTNPYLSFAMLFLTGALDNISVVVRQTLVQMPHSGRDAGAGLGRQHDLHRLVERARRIRVGHRRAAARHRARRGPRGTGDRSSW